MTHLVKAQEFNGQSVRLMGGFSLVASADKRGGSVVFVVVT